MKTSTLLLSQALSLTTLALPLTAASPPSHSPTRKHMPPSDNINPSNPGPLPPSDHPGPPIPTSYKIAFILNIFVLLITLSLLLLLYIYIRRQYRERLRLGAEGAEGRSLFTIEEEEEEMADRPRMSMSGRRPRSSSGINSGVKIEIWSAEETDAYRDKKEEGTEAYKDAVGEVLTAEAGVGEGKKKKHVRFRSWSGNGRSLRDGKGAGVGGRYAVVEEEVVGKGSGKSGGLVNLRVCEV